MGAAARLIEAESSCLIAATTAAAVSDDGDGDDDHAKEGNAADDYTDRDCVLISFRRKRENR